MKNFEKSKLQKEIKKLLTSLDEYAILNKLSREELLHNSKKEIKKLLTKSSESDILNRLSRETAKESSKRATKKNKKVLDKDKGF